MGVPPLLFTQKNEPSHSERDKSKPAAASSNALTHTCTKFTTTELTAAHYITGNTCIQQCFGGVFVSGLVCRTQKLISSGDVDVCTESLAPCEISVLGVGCQHVQTSYMSLLRHSCVSRSGLYELFSCFIHKMFAAAAVLCVKSYLFVWFKYLVIKCWLKVKMSLFLHWFLHFFFSLRVLFSRIKIICKHCHYKCMM